MRKCRYAMHFHVKVNFKSQIQFFPIPFLVLARNTIMLQHLIIHFILHYLSRGRLRGVKSKGKFQTFSFKSGRGLLRELVSDKRFQQYRDLT